MKIRDLLQQVSDPRGCGGKTVDPMGKVVVVDFKPDPCWFFIRMAQQAIFNWQPAAWPSRRDLLRWKRRGLHQPGS